MSDQPISLHAEGPPDTVLPPEPAEVVAALRSALALPEPERRAAVATVVAGAPRSLVGWSRLGQLARDDVEAYAAFRVGYHRGLDTLRQNGWRGNGYVRWSHESNRGFLSSLEGLREAAIRIGEADEAERCDQFLRQLDPAWPPPDLD